MYKYIRKLNICIFQILKQYRTTRIFCLKHKTHKVMDKIYRENDMKIKNVKKIHIKQFCDYHFNMNNVKNDDVLIHH